MNSGSDRSDYDLQSLMQEDPVLFNVMGHNMDPQDRLSNEDSKSSSDSRR